jgi:ABC-2 type transport system ATP-binding protein
VSDVESIASELAIMRSGRLVAFETPDTILSHARGQVWTATVHEGEYDALRKRVHVLQAQRQGGSLALRIAHPSQPCADALAAEPSLEEALMAQRYAVQEKAA